MTNRYKPNEATCPISLDVLALMLRSNEEKIIETLQRLSIHEQAQLAAFCFQRCHMRSLGLLIAKHCSEEALRKAAGSAGELLFEQSRSGTSFDAGPASLQKRKVTLARLVA